MIAPAARRGSAEMDRAFGCEVPGDLDEVCHPTRTAFIVYDMQAGLVSQIADGDAITARSRQVLRAARESGFRTFCTRHMSLPNECAGVSQLRRAKAWQRARSAADTIPAFPPDSPQFQITAELAALPSEAIVDKITMSAFAGTYLDIALRDCGINSFVIAGIALEVGIEPTVQHAADLGYIPIVVTDACGFGNATAAERSLAGLAFAGDAILADTKKVSDVLRRFQASG